MVWRGMRPPRGLTADEWETLRVAVVGELRGGLLLARLCVTLAYSRGVRTGYEKGKRSALRALGASSRKDGIRT